MRILHVLLIKGEDIVFTQPGADITTTERPRETLVMVNSVMLARFRTEYVLGWHYEEKEEVKKEEEEEAKE